MENVIKINGVDVNYLSKVNLRTLFTDKSINYSGFHCEYVIYCIHNDINGKCYIGQAKDFFTRFNSKNSAGHLGTLISYIKRKCDNSLIYNALRYHKCRNFTIYIIDEAETKEELNIKEKYWIKVLHTCKYDENPHGYNMTWGGEDCSNLHTDEIWKYREELGNGDVMWMCHTEESLRKSYDSKIKKYGSISSFLNTPESRAKALLTKSKIYNGDPHGQLHTEIARNNSIATTLITYITKYLSELKLDGASVPISQDTYWNWSGDYMPSSSHAYRHVRRVLNHLQILRKDDRWTDEMEGIFSEFERRKDELGL